MSEQLVANRPAVFLDRDGTLIEDVPYNALPERVCLADEAGPALRLLREAGFALLLVSNQSGIARGYFGAAALQQVEARLIALLAAEGVRLDGCYYCPHHPEGTIRRYAIACDCRKPAPGMIVRAAREHRIDLACSWMVGDILDDIEAGQRAGCRSVLLDNGHEDAWRPGPLRTPHIIVPDLWSAAEAIVRNSVSGTALEWETSA